MNVFQREINDLGSWIKLFLKVPGDFLSLQRKTKPLKEAPRYLNTSRLTSCRLGGAAAEPNKPPIISVLGSPAFHPTYFGEAVTPYG